MGADLIVAALATTEADGLDWDAGEEVARTIDINLILESDVADFLPEGADSNADEAREHLIGCVRDLKQSWGQGWRDQTVIDFGDWVIWVAGGTSYGDNPGPTFDAMNILSYVPAVLEAIGFDWPEAS